MSHTSFASRTTTPIPQIAPSASDDAHLSAYNAAFSDLDLGFRWDCETLNALREFESEVSRITAYITLHHAHLHRAYDAEFLAQLILRKKTQYYCEFAPFGENF